MKILLAIDGSYHSDYAVESVLQQPWPDNTRCQVVTVAEPLHQRADAAFVGGFGSLCAQAQQDLDTDIKKLLDDTCEKLKQKFGGNVDRVYREGRAADQILDLANSSRPDLIIIGSHGTSGYNHHGIFGSTTNSIINHAPCSVRIMTFLPADSDEKKLKGHLPIEEARFLVAIDSSPRSAAIIKSILARPWPQESLFQILSVVEEPMRSQNSRVFKGTAVKEADTKMYGALKVEAEKLIKQAESQLAEKFGKDKVTAHVLEGNTRSLILQIAQDWPADMIILGAHERDKSILEHFLGSVAQAVVSNAKCSLEIVRSAS